jgi:hypothetical protein
MSSSAGLGAGDIETNGLGAGDIELETNGLHTSFQLISKVVSAYYRH